MKLREITDRIYDKDDQHKMDEANEIYYSIAEYIEEANPAMYETMVKRAEHILYDFDIEWAQEKVRAMRPVGERWSYETIKQFLADKGISEKCKEYYLVMNMYANDAYTVAEKYGQDNPDFYFDMAKTFIFDEDAKSHKVAKYFCD